MSWVIGASVPTLGSVSIWPPPPAMGLTLALGKSCPFTPTFFFWPVPKHLGRKERRAEPREGSGPATGGNRHSLGGEETPLKKWRAASPSRSGGKWRSPATNLVSAERAGCGRAIPTRKHGGHALDYCFPGAGRTDSERHPSPPCQPARWPPDFSGWGRASQLAAAPVRPRGFAAAPRGLDGLYRERETGCRCEQLPAQLPLRQCVHVTLSNCGLDFLIWEPGSGSPSRRAAEPDVWEGAGGSTDSE